MKILAYSSLILGLILIALSRPSTDHPNLPVCIIGAAMSIVGSILLCRANMGNKVASKDKAQTNEAPRGFSIWRRLVELLAELALLPLVGGVMLFSGIGSSGKVDWRGGIESFVIAGIMILPAYFIAKHDRNAK